MACDSFAGSLVSVLVALKPTLSLYVRNIPSRTAVELQGVHKVLHTLKFFISQKPHKVETLHFRQ